MKSYQILETYKYMKYFYWHITLFIISHKIRLAITHSQNCLHTYWGYVQHWLLFLFPLSHLPVTTVETTTKAVNMQKQCCIFIESLLCDGFFFDLWEWLGGPWSPVSWNKKIQNMFWFWFKRVFLLSPDWASQSHSQHSCMASEQLQRNCFLLFP
jgi:hypothetical protein